MILSELLAVVKICREIANYVDEEKAKDAAQLEDIPDLDLLEARIKLRELKRVLDKIGVK